MVNKPILKADMAADRPSNNKSVAWTGMGIMPNSIKTARYARPVSPRSLIINQRPPPFIRCRLRGRDCLMDIFGSKKAMNGVSA